MKFIKLCLYITGVLLVAFSGCEDKFIELDKEPKNKISGDKVFEVKKLAETNLIRIYNNTVFTGSPKPHGGAYAHGWVLDEGMGGVARGFAYWQGQSAFPLEVIDADGAGPIDYWPYGNIRNVNEFIQGIKNSDFDQDFIDQKTAEARYIRAHIYFQMVMRYGGVPIITKPQDVDASREELFVERNSEQEVYDFIASEMDAIVSMFPEDAEKGRADKYTALALKSKAMLYAASIAEFGDVQMNGLLGIPNGEATKYWQASFNASQQIINSGNFSLYDENPENPAQNFQQLFVDEENNPEKIFVEVYDGENKGHGFDLGAVPYEFRGDWGSNFCPFVNIVEEFEYADGSSGEIDRDLINSDHLFDIDSIFRNRDPRFVATFFFPESRWQDGKTYFHRRTVKDGDTLTGWGNKLEDGWPASGPSRNWTNTGFLLRKKMDESMIKPGAGESDTDIIIFRYGEILLNYAEAAYYLGNQGEALNKINMIRERAGMPTLGSVTEEDIRHERTVELVFENHRYWDLRRWRTAHEFLHGLRTKGFEYTYYYDQDKYDISLKNGDPRARTFQQRHYYLPLGVDRVADNPELVENPGYASK